LFFNLQQNPGNNDQKKRNATEQSPPAVEFARPKID